MEKNNIVINKCAVIFDKNNELQIVNIYKLEENIIELKCNNENGEEIAETKIYIKDNNEILFEVNYLNSNIKIEIITKLISIMDFLVQKYENYTIYFSIKDILMNIKDDSKSQFELLNYLREMNFNDSESSDVYNDILLKKETSLNDKYIMVDNTIIDSSKTRKLSI